jgi:KRAB domain-containing zinc finger protein
MTSTNPQYELDTATGGVHYPPPPSALKPFSCDTCHKSFSQFGNLIIHNRIHTGEKPYSCEVCLKKFTQLSHLKGHARLHTGEKPFTCESCKMQFVQLNHLQSHKVIHHPEIVTGQTFPCPMCSKVFITAERERTHRKNHSEDTKLFTCPTCSKRFVNNGRLRIHMRLHTGERPYACTTCDKRFSQLGHLTFHLRGLCFFIKFDFI